VTSLPTCDIFTKRSINKTEMAAAAVHPVAFNDSHELLAAVQVFDKVLQSIGRENAENTGVLCSRHPGVIAAKSELTDLVSPHFPGVKRWFVPVAPVLPVDWTRRFSAYTTYLAPRAAITPRTLNTEIGVLKVVVSGSVEFGEYSLTQGDWIWLSPKENYNFKAEEAGAVIFTMLPCVTDTSDASEEAGLPNKLVDGTFITSRDIQTKAANIKLNHLEPHFEAGQGVSHKSFPFAPRLFHPTRDPGTEPGRFFAWLANIAPDAEISPHFHETEGLADVKLVISGSIFANGHELTAGDWFWAPSEGTYNFTAGERGALLLAGWPWN